MESNGRAVPTEPAAMADRTAGASKRKREDSPAREPSSKARLDSEQSSKNQAPSPQEHDSPAAKGPESTAGQPKEESQEKPTASAAPGVWWKLPCDPSLGQDHYFQHSTTNQTQWHEPTQGYHIWNPELQAWSSLVMPTTVKFDPTPEIERYNPKIHGNYDANAPYAQRDKIKREMEKAAEAGTQYTPAYNPAAAYDTSVTFNSVTGRYQNADQTADRHSDANKSHRQLNHFMDADAQANANDGVSLKQERQNHKPTKKEIQKWNKNKLDKKRKNLMAQYSEKSG